MKRILVAFAAGLIVLSITGCKMASAKQPTPFPTLPVLASPTALFPMLPTLAPTPAATAVVPVATLPANAPAQNYAPTPTVGGIVPGNPSGPYGVVLVLAGDTLNVRSGPGTSYPVTATLPSNANTVMRTGPSASVDGVLWVEIQSPNGGTGWVHSGYLTEYVAPATFCADGRAVTLVNTFVNALKTGSGSSLASLVSPASGWSVRLWRNGTVVVFDRQDTQWVFASTYQHHWGAAPGSGKDTLGSIHSVVFPKLLDVFNAPAGFSLGCNAVQAGGASYDTSWPAQYANINYYSVFKPGPAGNENSWRTVLIGIEYVQGQPYLFSTTQLEWEP